jgi:hypothetical protein
MKAETPFPRPSGSLARRVKGVEIILRERAESARSFARTAHDPSGQFLASLRGKAKAYDEAAELLRRIDQGRLLRFRKWTRKAGRA